MENNDNSIKITIDGSAKKVRDIVAYDLTDWKHSPPKGKIAVDPIHGRISFSQEDEIPNKVLVHYYGFSSGVGGGSYSRESPLKSNRSVDSDTQTTILLTNPDPDPDKNPDIIKTAIKKWLNGSDRKKSAIFKIGDSQIYKEFTTTGEEITLPAGVSLEIRAEQNQRPVIKLANPFIINGAVEPSDEGSKLMFDGLLFDKANENFPAGKPLLSINKGGDLRSLTLQH